MEVQRDCQRFSGGLAALCRNFGVSVDDPAPTPPPPPVQQNLFNNQQNQFNNNQNQFTNNPNQFNNNQNQLNNHNQYSHQPSYNQNQYNPNQYQQNQHSQPAFGYPTQTLYSTQIVHMGMIFIVRVVIHQMSEQGKRDLDLEKQR